MKTDGTIATSYLVDSSAWVEYFDGTPAGAKVKQILEDPSIECFTCGMVISEVISKAARRGFEVDIFFQEMKAAAKLAGEDSEDYFHAGIKHAELKK